MSNIPLSIVKATSDHSKDIWSWRNDPVTRSMFRSPDLVSWDVHEKWFENSLANPNRFIYVALINIRPVGMARFDAIPLVEGRFEISVNIAPCERRTGIGRNLFRDSIRELQNEVSCVKEIVAQIKSANTASNSYFHSLGFVPQELAENGYQSYIYKV